MKRRGFLGSLFAAPAVLAAAKLPPESAPAPVKTSGYVVRKHGVGDDLACTCAVAFTSAAGSYAEDWDDDDR